MNIVFTRLTSTFSHIEVLYCVVVCIKYKIPSAAGRRNSQSNVTMQPRRASNTPRAAVLPVLPTPPQAAHGAPYNELHARSPRASGVASEFSRGSTPRSALLHADGSTTMATASTLPLSMRMAVHFDETLPPLGPDFTASQYVPRPRQDMPLFFSLLAKHALVFPPSLYACSSGASLECASPPRSSNHAHSCAS